MNITVSVLTNGAQAELARVKAQLAQLQGQLEAAGRAEGPGSGRQLTALAKYGNQLQWTGRQLQYNFTLPLAIAGAAATNFALENEKAFTRISKVYGDATISADVMKNELNALRKAFVALSNHYGVHQAEVLNIAADWAAAGASGVALARGVEQTLITMVLGEMQAKEATEALIAIQAQYNLSSMELVETIAKLNVVENQTGISLQGLVQGFARAAGVAREAGVDVEHLAAMLAALTPTAGTAAQAGNALKTMISRILSPTGEARDILEAMGVAVDGLAWKSANGSQRIELLALKFHELDDAQKAVVSSTLASRYQINRFDALMDSVYKKLDNNVKTTGYYGRALEATANRAYYLAQAENELNAVLESNPQRLKQIWVILENALADIIQPLIPVILMAATVIKDLVEAFRGLPPELQKAIIMGLLFLALFGPLIRYIGSTMTLIGELTWFLGGLARALLIVFAPLKLVTSGLAALGTAYMSIRKVFLGVVTALLAGSNVWQGVLAAMFGKKAAAAILGFAARVGVAFVAIHRGIIALFINLVPFIFLTMGRITKIVRVAAIAIPVIFAEVSAAIVAIWRGLGAVMYALSYAAVFAAGVAWRAGLMLITAFQALWSVGIMGAWRVLQVGLAVLTTEGLVLIRLIWTRGLAAIQALLLGFAAFAGGLWRAMLVGIQTMTLLFTVNLGKMLRQVLVVIRGIIPLLLAALTSPWGIAIAAVVGLLVLFRDQIAEVIQNIINYFGNLPANVAGAFRPLVDLFNRAVAAIVRAFYALPEGVQNAMRAVVEVVYNAVMAVYRLFSYLNPFAHHSPSLVENVTNGMAEVRRQFGSITDIAGPINQAYRDLQRFGKAAANLLNANDAANRAADRATIAQFAPGALASYDALIADLKVLTPLLDSLSAAVDKQQAVVDGLKDSLDAANQALDEQQKKLDDLQKVADTATANLDEARQRLSDFANTPIVGMKAMEDQIFANEMAQKRLRLEMLKMDDAVGGVENLRDKLSTLQGQIELLSGEQNELRAGGAGSEILSQYDDQIRALEDQQDGIKDTIKQYDDLSDELERLQRQGEMLDLEKSLKFDELTKQINDAANAMQEMPFDEIMAGVQQANADIAKYTAEVEKANAAVDAQKQVVDAATAARDAIQARYDQESAKLEVLRNKYNQVEEAIRDINSALQEVTQAAEESARRIQEALDKGGAGGGGSSPALDNFKGAAGGNFPDVAGTGSLGREGGFGDQSALIDQFTQDLAKKTGDLFAEFDIFGPIKKKWNEFTSWWSANINPALSSAWGGVKEIWKNTVGNVDWGAPFRGVDWKGIFGSIGGTVRDVFNTARTWGRNIWNLFRDDIIEIWNTIREKFKKAIDEIGPELGKFKDEIKPAADAIKTLWERIKPLAAILGGALLAALKIVSSVIANIFGPALDIVIGVIKGFVGIIRGWVQIIIGLISGDLGKVWEGVKTVWSSTLNAIWDVLKGAWGVIKGIVTGIVEGIVDFFAWLKDVLVGHSIVPDMVNDIIDWIASLPSKAWNALKDFGSKIIDKVQEAWDWWVRKNEEMWGKIWDWMKTLPGKARDAIADLVNKLRDKAKEAWDAFKSKSSEVWNSIESWVKGLPGKTGTAIGNIVSTLRTKAQDAWNAFKTRSSEIWSSISSWISGRPAAAGSAIANIVGTLGQKGKDAMNSLKNGLTGVWGSVSSWLSGLGGRIKSAIGNLGSLLYNIGKSILQGLLDGLKRKWEDVKSFVGGIGSWIENNKGPVSKDRKLLIPAGVAIIGGLGEGLEKQWPSVQTFVKSLAPAIAATFANAGGMWGANPLEGIRMGITPGGMGHAEARANAAASQGTTTVNYGGNAKTVIIINGNLEFPNIKSGDDAESFISHLETLAGAGGQ